MTPDKLEALRRLAADEGTPEEEARTAALMYVRKGGKVESPSTNPRYAPDDAEHIISVLESENARLSHALETLWVVIRKIAEGYKAKHAGDAAIASAGYMADELCRYGIKPKSKT